MTSLETRGCRVAGGAGGRGGEDEQRARLRVEQQSRLVRLEARLEQGAHLRVRRVTRARRAVAAARGGGGASAPHSAPPGRVGRR